MEADESSNYFLNFDTVLVKKKKINIKAVLREPEADESSNYFLNFDTRGLSF